MPEEQSATSENIVYYDQRSVALRTKQSIYFVKEHDKMSMLEFLLNDYKDIQVVIVVKSKKKADTLSALLLSKAFKAISVHGNHRQEKQQKAATEFNACTLNVIISTDMILKTLALENIKLLVSYDLPDVAEEYYKRLAYMKELGTSIAFVNPEDEVLLDGIEYNMKKEIEEKEIEGFVASATPLQTSKKNRTKKPRHRKKSVKDKLL